MNAQDGSSSDTQVDDVAIEYIVPQTVACVEEAISESYLASFIRMVELLRNKERIAQMVAQAAPATTPEQVPTDPRKPTVEYLATLTGSFIIR